MRLDTSMSQRLEQKMILAPRMIQSMEILQLPVMALQERVEHELQENPVLELKEDNPDENPAPVEDLDETPPAPEPEPADVGNPEKELVIDDKGDNEQDFDRLMAINEDWADHFNEEHRPSSNRIDEEGDKKHDAMVNMASRPQSLQDYLNDQLAFLDVPPEDLELLQYLISHIDDRGYLATPLEDISRGLDPSITLALLELALARIQMLEPPGVSARDYKECLLLQVNNETTHREVVRALILNHLQDIQH